MTADWEWATWVGAFRIPGCGALSATPFSQEVCKSAGTADFTLTVKDTFQGSTLLSTPDCPPGGVCTFTPNPVASPPGDSTLSVALGGIAGGGYNITVNAVEQANPSNTGETVLGLIVTEAAPGAPTMVSPADNATNVAVRPTFQWTSATGTEFSI